MTTAAENMTPHVVTSLEYDPDYESYDEALDDYFDTVNGEQAERYGMAGEVL
jgi:hypothetical protein